MNAARDAVAAGQAEFIGNSDRLEWKVEGELEVDRGEAGIDPPDRQG